MDPAEGSIMASATPTAQVRNILVFVRTITMTSTSTRKRQRLFHAVRPHVANPVIKTDPADLGRHPQCAVSTW
jgi:hypothetical protein